MDYYREEQLDKEIYPEDQNQIEKIIKVAILKIGIKCDTLGYGYIFESVMMVITHPNLVYNAKKLFTKVGEKLGITNYLKIESNIQNAINFTYNMRGFNSINELYGLDVIRPDHKPTVAELINLLAQYYLLRMFKTEEIS